MHCYVCYWYSSSSSSLSLGPVANTLNVLQPLRLIVLPYPPLCSVVPTTAARCLHVRNDARDPSSERWNCVGKKVQLILLNDFHAI